MSDETTLLPCPFCGGEAEPFNPFDNADGTWCVLCSECAAATGFEQTESEAIAAWNTRATHSALTAEQVREAVMSADRWEKPMGNTGMTNTHLIVRDDAWQAIADELNSVLDKGNNGECYLVHDGEKYPVKLDFGFLGMMPITITVGGFRYLVEVPNGE